MLFCLAALLGCAAAVAPSRALLQGPSQGPSGPYCRAESSCISQFCNPLAYQYNISSAGVAFPYNITYTTTASGATTTFVFNVCSIAAAAKECTPTSPGCGPLKAVQLRIRDDMLMNGTDITANPAGSMWASCKPYGPGHLWDVMSLGALAVNNATNTTCQTLTVTSNSNANGVKAGLSDICQQDIKIVDNKNKTVYDQSTQPNSCLFVLEEASGRVGYGTVVDESAMVMAPAPAPEDDYPVLITSFAPSTGPSPYGPTPYGSGLRRRLQRAQATHKHVPAPAPEEDYPVLITSFSPSTAPSPYGMRRRLHQDGTRRPGRLF